MKFWIDKFTDEVISTMLIPENKTKLETKIFYPAMDYLFQVGGKKLYDKLYPFVRLVAVLYMVIIALLISIIVILLSRKRCVCGT